MIGELRAVAKRTVDGKYFADVYFFNAITHITEKYLTEEEALQAAEDWAKEKLGDYLETDEN